MSDNLRRYRAIREALTQWYPGQPTGRVARHLTTLAALISGIVGSKSTQLPSVATKIPDGTKPESRVKRLTRWLDNARILEEVYFLPYAESLLAQLALETLVIVMDSRVVGRGCLALRLHVVDKGRALPLAWRVRHSPKGHCPEELHIAMVELMSTVIPGKRSQECHEGTNLAQVGRRADRAHIAVRAAVIAAHRITSSAWKRMDEGSVRPRAWAVLRLMTNSNLVGLSTGSSAGLVPFRILST